MQLLRKQRRPISIFLIVVFLATLNPSWVWANNGGPKQPEAKSFTPVGVTEMVDPFTGNFSYNIPLLDVGGYPINISYKSDPTIDEQASWVGLGWNINVGNIDRSIRGVPDDFSGDQLKTTTKKKPNQTIGVNTGVDVQIFGIESKRLGLSVGLTVGVFHNNYTGFGRMIGLNGGMDLKVSETGYSRQTVGLGIGVTSHTTDGMTVSPSINYAHNTGESTVRGDQRSFALGSSFNTLQGWSEYTLTGSVSTNKNGNRHSHSATSKISYAAPTSFPRVSAPLNSMSLSFNATLGGALWGFHLNGNVRAFYSYQTFKDDTFVTPPTKGMLSDPGFLLSPISNDVESVLEGVTNSFKSVAHVSLPSYGYLYSHKGKAFDKVIHDFNRENDGPFTIHKPNLAIPVYTHDIYSIGGQGVGGMYRPFRNDIGILHDPAEESGSTDLDLPPLELGGGNTVHIGTNLAVADVTSTSGKWVGSNDFVGEDPFSLSRSGALLGFHDYDTTVPAFQPYYFKQAGEKTSDFSSSFIEKFGGYDPVSFKVYDGGIIQKTLQVKRGFKKDDVEEIVLDEKILNEYRRPRNQNIQFLTAEEAHSMGVEKYIHVYPENDFTMDEYGRYIPSKNHTLFRLDEASGRKSHHISEITATTPMGIRYIYGLPTYNTIHKEVSFALECSDADPQFLDHTCYTGTVKYDPGKDNSVENEKGIDNHFEEKSIPPYANSFLLTAILSDDFVDVANDGPTDDDIGSYTKFNYTKVSDDNKWRSPVYENYAHYFEGLNANPNDGRGSYSYGVRELWYLHSIETKTHVAEFVLEDREDAISVSGEDGGLNTSAPRMKKLVRIDLFAKPDKLKEVKSNGTYSAIPIKSVYFEYDYSLCPGIPDNPQGGGKLTLKKIKFSYQNSFKSILSPYEFTYQYNPGYDEKAHDRWGVYKPQSAPENENCENHLSNTDFPYAEQDITLANEYAASWNLTKILLPSGATITVDYESDEYAYVQDKPAAQMFMIEGFGSDNNTNHIKEQGEDDVDNVIFFKLTDEIPADYTVEEAQEFIAEKYLKNIVTHQEYLYFKCFVRFPTSPQDGNASRFDYVPGYAKIDLNHSDPYGAVKNTDQANDDNVPYNYGYIRVKNSYIGSESAEDGDANDFINPITKWGIGLAKMNMPWLNTQQDNNNAGCKTPLDENLLDLLEKTVEAYSVVGAIARETFSAFNELPIAKEANLNKSFIRLYNPNGHKRGGGSRVKRITVSDDWAAITQNAFNVTQIRGQEYSYLLPDSTSSGVASWEPVQGGEENPFKLPIFVREDREGIPDEEYFLESPMGESFFPSPVVGYSMVTIRDISGTQDVEGNIDYAYNKTGRSESEFYTAKDFPVKSKFTAIDLERQDPLVNIVQNFLKIDVKDYATASQGYAIELNDMHGKPKSQRVYQESSDEESPAPLSSIEYVYKTNPETGDLDNNVLVMNRYPDGNRNDFIEERTVGVDYDFITDMNSHESKTVVITTQGNVETFFAAIFPIIVPIIIPERQQQVLRLRTAVSAKIINRYGLIDKVITQDLGKHDEATNELYDAETGEVLMKSTLNSYGDPVYVFNYPAHFGYDGMGPAYKNSDVILETEDLNNIPNASTLLVPGDELLTINLDSLNNSDSTTNAHYVKGWVKSTNGNITDIIDIQGYPLELITGEGKYLIKVLRSGRKNLQMSSMGSVVSLKNPMVKNQDGTYSLAFEEVLDANAIEYDHIWRTLCECDDHPPKFYEDVK